MAGVCVVFSPCELLSAFSCSTVQLDEGCFWQDETDEATNAFEWDSACNMNTSIHRLRECVQCFTTLNGCLL